MLNNIINNLTSNAGLKNELESLIEDNDKLNESSTSEEDGEKEIIGNITEEETATSYTKILASQSHSGVENSLETITNFLSRSDGSSGSAESSNDELSTPMEVLGKNTLPMNTGSTANINANPSAIVSSVTASSSNTTTTINNSSSSSFVKHHSKHHLSSDSILLTDINGTGLNNNDDTSTLLTKRKSEDLDSKKNQDLLLESSGSSSESESETFEIDNKMKNSFALTDYDRLPSYLQGNEYIMTGYRVNFSYKLCLQSIFRMHNETLNIWTHLIGTIGFIIIMIYTQVTILHDSDPMDKFIFTIFFFGAICQMLFSTLFHTFCSVSPTTYLWFARLDYTGISLMIVGSYFPVLYYIFKCIQPLATLYISGVSFLGIVGVIVGMLPVFQTHRFRTFRAVFFIIFGLYIVIPLPHLWIIKGFDFFFPVLWRLMLMGSIYISGATIYSTRCPECCLPGKFDNSWSSHPIWHIFCIVAALTQYYVCIYSYFNYGSLCS